MLGPTFLPMKDAWLPAISVRRSRYCYAAVLSLLLPLLWTRSAATQESPSPRADQLDSSLVDIRPVIGSVANSCVAAFNETSIDETIETRSLRARYLLPHDRAWVLLSFIACGSGSSCPEWLLPNGSSALAFDGYGTKVYLDPLGTPDGARLAPIAALASASPTEGSLSEALNALGDVRSSLSSGYSLPHRSLSSSSAEFWTGKLHGDKATYLLFYAPTATAPAATRCALHASRTGLFFTHNQSKGHFHLDVPTPTKSVAPQEAANDRTYDGASHHVVRIEWVANRDCMNGSDAQCIHYCSGIVLGTDARGQTMKVLTAGHCLADDSRDGSDACPDNKAVCDSYDVDVYLSNVTEKQARYVSLPVLSVDVPQARIGGDEDTDVSKLHYEPDYAILTLPARVPAQTAPLSRSPDPIVFQTPENASHAFVVAHPLGHPAEVSPYCAVYALDSSFYHTCYTRGGSSGAPLWWDDKKNLIPLAIHTDAVLDCANPGDSANHKAWRTFRDSPDNGEFMRNFGNDCIGRSLPIESIYCDYCMTQGHAREGICQQLARLRSDAERKCPR